MAVCVCMRAVPCRPCKLKKSWLKICRSAAWCIRMYYCPVHLFVFAYPKQRATVLVGSVLQWRARPQCLHRQLKCLCVSKTESYGLSRICFEMTRQATMPSSKAWLCLADEQYNIYIFGEDVSSREEPSTSWPSAPASVVAGGLIVPF
jgi:hypothetical protein